MTGEYSCDADVRDHLSLTLSGEILEQSCTAPVIDQLIGDGTDCHGGATGEIILDITGGTPFAGPPGCQYIIDWDWDGTPGDDDYPNVGCGLGGDLQYLSNLPSGTYYVTITDANGCTATGSVNVDEPSGDAIDIDAPGNIHLDCHGIISEIIDISVSGGFGFYSYEWDWNGSPYSTQEDPLINGPGTHTLTVTDFLGCTSTFEVEVTEPDELDANATSDPVLCTGGATGAIQLTVNGGTPGYLFDWDYDGTGDNNDPQNPSGLSAGTHTVTVTDANGCTATATVTVTEPTSPISASASATDITCYGEDNGIIDLTPSGGTGSYTYDWDNDGTGDNNDPQDLSNLSPGTYSVTVTDANGCSTATAVTIDEPGEISDSFSDDFCESTAYTLPDGSTTSSAGQHGPFVFTAANGCDSLVYVDLSQLPQVTTNLADEFCEGGSFTLPDGSTTSVAGMHGPFTFTAANGCDSLVYINLTELPEVTTNLEEDLCAGDTYTLPDGTTTSAGGQFGPYTFTASGGCDSLVFVDLTPLPDVTVNLADVFCQGESFTLPDGSTVSAAGQYGPFNFTAASGCDSLVYVDLTELPDINVNLSGTFCEGNTYTLPDGSTTTTGGQYGPFSFPSGNGCDSLVTIDLTELPQPETNLEDEICAGENYTLPDGSTTTTGGQYGPFVFPAANGCDSLVFVDLTAWPEISTNISDEFCEGTDYILPDGTTASAPGQYGPFTFPASNGCDSLVVVDLTEVTVLTTNLTGQFCEGDTYTLPDGTTTSAGGQYGPYLFTSQQGCDSVVLVELTELSVVTVNLEDEFCEGSDYTLPDGSTTTTGGQYGPFGFISSQGCDSIVYLDLTALPPVTSGLDEVICEGDTYTLPDGSTTTTGGLYGPYTFTTSEGCDSLVFVDLMISPIATTDISDEICEGHAYVLPDGSTTTTGGEYGPFIFTAANGCDSIIHVHLAGHPNYTVNFTHFGCQGDGFEVMINGTVYDELNPSGAEHMTTIYGCDSTVNVQLFFSNEINTYLTPQVCTGGSVTINGEVFDALNPAGLHQFTAQGGCDSLVHITLEFLPVPEGEETYAGCIGDGYSVLVNGTLYDEQHPSGTEWFQTPGGCDTIVNIWLTFAPAVTLEVDTTLCFEDFLVINGTIYDRFNPAGTEILPGQGPCDTLVVIDLAFLEPASSTITYDGCQGDGYAVIVNTVVYDESNPVGEEYIQTPDGCDSVVFIQLAFHPSYTADITHQGCNGDGFSVTVNGTLYNEGNPSGVEHMLTVHGCDSVVNISLFFTGEIHTWLAPPLCPGDSVTIGGITYDASNPSGDQYYTAAGGCDSIVHINVLLLQASAGDVMYTGCLGDGYSVVVNGTVYDEQHPSGVEMLQAANGCDSVVTISLVFDICCLSDTTYVSHSVCEGDAYDFHGNTYTASGTYTHLYPDAVGPGCDSVFILDLTVTDIITAQIDGDICEGENYWFSGQFYSQTGVYTDTLHGGSAFGCDSVIILVLQVHPLPVADAGDTQHITCASPTVKLNGAAQGGQLLWTGSGINASNEDLPEPVVSRPGIYILTVVSPEGCTARDSVLVTIDESTPVADAGPDRYLTCEVRSVILDPVLQGANLRIRWEGEGITENTRHLLQPEVEIAGVYILHLTDTLSMCDALPDTMLVTDISNEVKAIVAAPSDMTCLTQFIVLDGSSSTAGGHIIYRWINESGHIVSNAATAEITQAGRYTLLVRDTLTGCEESATVAVINNDEYPAIALGEDKALDCLIREVQIEATIGDTLAGFEVKWTGPQGGIKSDPEQLQIIAGEAGWYILSVANTENGCISTDSVLVEDKSELPGASAVVDHHINCHHASAQLRSVHAQSSGQLMDIWYDKDGNMVDTAGQVAVDAPGMYYLKVHDMDNGCTSEDSVMVIQTEAPEGILETDDEHCAGDHDGYIMVMEVMGGTAPFMYEVEGVAMQSSPMFDHLVPNDYIVRIIDNDNCRWEEKVTIAPGLVLKLEIGPDIQLRPGEQIVLEGKANVPVSMIDSITWAPASLVSCSSCLTTVITGLMSGAVTATVYVDGCWASAQVDVVVKHEYDVYAPNVFSPNFDGVNDYFTIYGDESLETILELQVFDRWGNIVYSRSGMAGNEPRDGWDGTCRGKPMNPGVFVYRAVLEFVDGNRQHFSGNVTLVR